jgi:hypothetical protein
MTTFRVQAEELVSAATGLSRSITELEAAGAAVVHDMEPWNW